MKNSRGKRAGGSRRNNRNRGISGPDITKAEISRLLSDSAAFQGQQHEVVRLPGTTGTATTTVTTGVISIVATPNIAQITGITRFTNAWDEYRVIHVTYELYPVVVSTGVTSFWWDEKSNNAPTANEAQERDALRCLNTNAPGKIYRVSWQPRDLFDLEMVPTSNTTPNNVYFKIYTNSTSWDAPIAVTNLWIYRPIITVEFRGLKST